MSGRNRRLSSQPYRTPYPTIWAACAALITLAVAACASSAATTPASPAPTPATFGTVSHAGTLTGAGSTFVAPFFAAAAGDRRPGAAAYSPVWSSTSAPGAFSFTDSIPCKADCLRS